MTAALRTGSVADLDAVLALLDGAVAWLVAQGRTGQWGEQPWSASEARVARIRGMVEGSELLLLERDGAAVAALAHGPAAHDYVPPVTEPEDYVLLLVSDPSARGAGRRLLDESWASARAGRGPAAAGRLLRRRRRQARALLRVGRFHPQRAVRGERLAGAAAGAARLSRERVPR